MALPLARYLAPTSRYVGFDIVREPVDWCRRHVAPRRPGFAFEHVDFRHPLYNPGGTVPSAAGFAGRIGALRAWRPSVVAAVSVFTHLGAPRSDEPTSGLQSLLPIAYAGICSRHTCTSRLTNFARRSQTT